ncbi:HAD family hydrolase [Ruegeria sp. 2205SS24-7]|uniref:HAD family hydrolase n=1 Tax=Ruegeria discodermiae TaxID=3064389 RepID=UPI00274098AC|nr:HAD family hydrolase [Ruegeria sp. 2205SS24-7]MDP5218453.1 HAD family hydrolase [Ruegeria sp. 2205SS24-7]
MLRLSLPLLFSLIFSAARADPLPSWNDTDSKARIISFVENVTDAASDDYVTPSDRIAVFDNDGTLWGEQPVYFQLIYAVDAFQKMAQDDPSLITSDALKAAAEGDYSALAEGGKEAVIEVLGATHSGLNVDDFQASVANWVATASHPVTGLRYDQMTYQPMVELLRYLRDEGFKTYIVSGGGIHFMRVFAEAAYGIPTEQVIGTYTETSYEVIDGVPTITKQPAIGFVDDKEGKPINIDRIIGKRPIIGGGNSDGDYAMIEWTTAGAGPRLGLIVHHTDGEREVAYDCDSHIGRLCDGLENGPNLGWLIVDMARDWSRIYTGAQ